MELHYPALYFQYFRLALAVLSGKHLSFRRVASACVNHLNPGLDVKGIENLPVGCGYTILVNHYYRPGFLAWWIPLAISSVISQEMHWIMAGAWTYPDKPYGKHFEQFSRILFGKIAGVFHFTNMPPMPPRLDEVNERAQAVRKVMRLIRENPNLVLGLAPEGSDNMDGKMHLPPSGAGRFIYHLQDSGHRLVPAGIFETDRLCLRFGPPFCLDRPHIKSPDDLDDYLNRQVYRAIAALLPENLLIDYLVK